MSSSRKISPSRVSPARKCPAGTAPSSARQASTPKATVPIHHMERPPMTRSWYREQPAVTQKATSLPNAVQMQKSIPRRAAASAPPEMP